METDITNGQTGQAMQIMQQIQQLETQNTSESQLSSLEQKLINDINNNKWGQAETVMKRIIKIEASENSAGDSGWAYSQLGQIIQQQGNNNVNVFNNGSQINFDVQPTIINGRTMIPVRAVANALGISDNGISYSNGTVTINNGSSQIVFNNNAQQASLNGTSYSLDVPAQIVNGRMMVPLRAISQMFNKNVQWYPNGRIVSIQ